MARNGSGTYTNPYPDFISGTVISSTQVDANNSDIATALTQSIAVDGQAVVTADIPLATHKFTAMKVGTASTDSLSLGQAQAEAFVWCGTAGGGADAITLSPSPAITAYAAGQRFVWMASGSTNTTATTVAISGLTAIALQDNGAALTAGQHAAGKMFMGILNTTSTVQVIGVQLSGTDPLIVSSLTVTGDATIGDDLTLLSDASVLGFGEHTDVKITHVHDSGLTLKNTSTADDTPFVLLVQTGETDIALNDALGKIQFQAPDEATGTDSRLVAAEIAAISEGDFSASNNATKLSFKTGASEAATEKMSLSSGGNLTVSGTIVIPDAGNIGSASDTDAIAISSAGVVALSATTEASATATAALTTAGGLGVAKDVWIGDDLVLDSDAAVVSFGDNQEVTLTHVHDTGLLLNSTMALQFNDASQYINAPSNAILDINATDEIELNATLVDVNANLDVSGTMTTGGNIVIPDDGNIGSASDTDAMTLSAAGVLTIDGSTTVLGGATYGCHVQAGGVKGTGSTNDNSGYSFFANNSDDTTQFYVRNDGVFNTGVDGNSPYNLTTASGDNVYVSAGGSLYRSTSSARFKTNVEPIDDTWADKILDMQPIFYKSIATGDVGVMPENWTHYGFSAEQVATVDPRLVSFKTHDYHMGGAEGDEEISTELDEPIADGVQYTKMIPALVNLIKRQRDEISALTARVLALET